MTLTPEELRHEAELLDPVAPHVAAYLRACAEARPVALVGANALGEKMLCSVENLAGVHPSWHKPVLLFAHPSPDETAALRADAEGLGDMLTISHLSPRADGESLRSAIDRLINWHCAVHGDPAVSSHAAGLVEQGRQEMRARVAELEAALLEVKPIARMYAKANPRGEYQGQVQDPHGVHGWLERNDTPGARNEGAPA